MMINVRCSFVALSLSFALAAGAVALEPRQTALGPDGEIYRLLTGTYGQYFPAGLIPSVNPVLVLEILRPGVRKPIRMLVPGTESEDIELAPSVSFEERSNSLTVIWSSERNFIHSRINFAVLTDGRWSQAVELSGDVWSRKSSPAVAVTHDDFLTIGETGAVSHARTIYNVVWWEEAGAGDRIAYSPVVFLDGVYVGWNPVFVLTDLTQGAAGSTPAPNLSADLLRAPIIQASGGGSSAMVGFVHPTSGQLITLEVDAVAGELALLADEVKADLIDFAATHPNAGTVELGERARHQVVEFGTRLGMHPGLVDFLSKQLETDIHVGGTDTTAMALADRARHQVVEFGVRMMAQGLTGNADSSPAWVAEFGNQPGQSPDEGTPLQSIRLRLVASWPAPVTDPGSTSLLLSVTGKSALVAWIADPAAVRYFETVAGGWSGLHKIRLTTDLSLDQVLALLEARVGKS